MTAEDIEDFGKEGQIVWRQTEHCRKSDPIIAFIKHYMDIDKQFILTVPSYEHVEDHVIYMFRLEDTIKNKVYVSGFRFKDLQ